MGNGRGWDTIREVTGAAEREQVFRFRYRIYVEEMARVQRYADHAARRIEDPLDEGAVNLAAFDRGDVVGVVRINYPTTSSLGVYEDLYRMRAFAGGDHPDATFIVTRLMIESALRKGLLGYRLCLACYEHGLRNGARSAFIDCNDHLVPFFRGLGFHAYMGTTRHEEYGEVLPMKLDMADEANLAAVRSPFLAALRKWQRASPAPDIERSAA